MTSLEFTESNIGALGTIIAKVVDCVHVLASLTVRVYMPADKLLNAPVLLEILFGNKV